MRPAYLVDSLRRLFPALQVEYPQNRPVLDMVLTPGEGVDYLAGSLRMYAEGSCAETQAATLYEAYGQEETLRVLRTRLLDAAFGRQQEGGLPGEVARALYGTFLENSVSRLETFAACAYHHFLQYGLSLKEREEFGFEGVDLGNAFHAVLEQFSKELETADCTWFDFSREYAAEGVHRALEQYAAGEGLAVLYSSARNEYMIRRMERILVRTVLTLQEQLKRGEFRPRDYEVSFRYADQLDSIQVTLSEEEKMRLRGRIDRIDVAEDDEHVYVKVIDYKSGDKQFDLAALYYGLQLQLVVYMNAAMELERKKHPDKEVVPAALLYYHVEDPMVEAAGELSEEELNHRILEQLRSRGVVNDNSTVVDLLDRSMGSRSEIIPVERKKDGSFSARSSVLSTEELQLVSGYVSRKVRQIGQEILAGHVERNPYEKGSADACMYCPYRKVCGFDPAVPGSQKRVLSSMSKEEALERMRAEQAKE